LRFARVVALAGAIAATVALAVLRVYTSPIFENSDEPDHFDYTISLVRSGHLLSAHNPLGFPTADLESAFLETYSDFSRIYLNPGERAPAVTPAYGSHQYFARIDLRSRTELPDPHAYMNAANHPNPVLISMYPFAYYAANAGWLALFAHADPSLSAVFFAARWFSVALLVLTLAFAFGVVRELGMRRVPALAFLAIAGGFGLTTFVASSVQPDNLALLATTATFFCALRLRRARRQWEWLGFACVLGVLSVTKYQIALCVVLAAGPAAAYAFYLRTRSLRRTLALALLVALPAAVLLTVQTVAVGKNDAFSATLGTHFVFTSLQKLPQESLHFANLLGEALRYYFVGNVTPPLTRDYRYAAALSYWNYFGNLDTYVTLVNPQIDRFVRDVFIPAATILTALLTIAGSATFAVRLVHLAKRGRVATALKCALASVPLNAYYIFALFMIVFYALTNNVWRQSGRNWIAFLVPALLFGVHYAPRVLPGRRLRAAFGGTLFVLLALYSSAGSFYAASAVERRYYGASSVPPLARLERGPKIDILIGHVGDTEVDVKAEPVVPIVRGQPIEIEGLASDMPGHDAASGVIGLVDGRDEIAASYQYAHQDFAERLHDERLFWAGFHLTVPTANMALGPHRIALYIVSKDRTHYFPTAKSVNFESISAGPPRPAVIGDRSTLVGSLDKVAPLEAAGIDGPETSPVVFGRTRSLYLKGWLVDIAHRRPLRAMYVRIDGRQRFAIHPGELRPELRANFPQIAPLTAAYGGFSGIVPLHGLSTGPHRFSIVAVDATGHSAVVLADFPFEIRGATVPHIVEPAPLSLPKSFHGKRYVGSIDAIAPMRDETYWNAAANAIWVQRGEPLVVRGWGIDVLHRRALHPMTVIVDNAKPLAARVGDSRPDVVLDFANLPQSATAGSGFNASVPTKGLELGLHFVSVTTVDPLTHRPIALAEKIPFTVY